jgi:hypothetical protein
MRQAILREPGAMDPGLGADLIRLRDPSEPLTR